MGIKFLKLSDKNFLEKIKKLINLIPLFINKIKASILIIFYLFSLILLNSLIIISMYHGSNEMQLLPPLYITIFLDLFIVWLYVIRGLI